MASSGCLGVLVPSHPVRNIRTSDRTLCERRRRGDFGYSTIGGGPGFCGSGPRRGLQKWYIPRDYSRARTEGEGERGNYLVSFHCVAREGRRAERKICRESVKTVKKVEKRNGENGVAVRIRHELTAGRLYAVHGHRRWVSSSATSPSDARLVHFPLQRTLLSVCGTAVRMGEITAMVYPVYGRICAATTTTRLPRPGLSRRLPDRTLAVWNRIDLEGLRARSGEDIQSGIRAGAYASPDEGRVAGISSNRAPRRSHRHDPDEILSHETEGGESTSTRWQVTERSHAGPTVGRRTSVVKLLRHLRCPYPGDAMGEVLHSFFILGHVLREAKRPARKMSLVTPVRSRPSVLEEALKGQSIGKTDCASTAGSGDAHRCRRYGLWGYLEHSGRTARNTGYVVCPSRLGLERTCNVHHTARIAGNPKAFVWTARAEGAVDRNHRSLASRGQPSSCTHYKQLCFCKPFDDERIAALEGRARPFGITNKVRVDSIRRQQICRRFVATLPPRRLADSQAAAAFHRGWNEGSSRRFQISPARRASIVPTSGDVRGAEQGLGQGSSTVTLPTSGSDRGNCSQAGEDGRTGNPAHSGLAASAVAPGGVELGERGSTLGSPAERSLARPTSSESAMEADSTGGESMRTRSAARMELSRAAASHILNVAGNSPGARMSAELVADYAWSERTSAARNSQWKAWVQFCDSEQRAPLPVTEAHFVAFIGWLKLARDRGERAVGSSSLPQYLSAVRQMQLMLTGVPVPQYPFVSHILRAYRKWEEANYPLDEVRCGVPAGHVQRIWAMGMNTESVVQLRDCALCVFSYCFNGLRESSMLSLLSNQVSITTDCMTARLSVVKGRQASREQLVAYHRISDLPSPLDLFSRWKAARGNHPRFFAVTGEPQAWVRQSMTRACTRVMDTLKLQPPLGGKFTSHSFRIGSHTEQVLLGIPLEVRLSRFGWSKDSADMAALYFDRTIRTTAASYWFFGPAPSTGPASIPPPPEA